MKLKLKENPVECLKFTAVIGSMFGLIWTLTWGRGIHQGPWWAGWIPGIVATILCSLFPRGFRGFYRVGTTLFFYLGQAMGTLLLFLFFILVLTPLGVILRLLGKDLLRLKKQQDVDTYWQTTRGTGGHDKMF